VEQSADLVSVVCDFSQAVQSPLAMSATTTTRRWQDSQRVASGAARWPASIIGCGISDAHTSKVADGLLDSMSVVGEVLPGRLIARDVLLCWSRQITPARSLQEAVALE